MQTIDTDRSDIHSRILKHFEMVDKSYWCRDKLVLILSFNAIATMLKPVLALKTQQLEDFRVSKKVPPRAEPRGGGAVGKHG